MEASVIRKLITTFRAPHTSGTGWRPTIAGPVFSATSSPGQRFITQLEISLELRIRRSRKFRLTNLRGFRMLLENFNAKFEVLRAIGNNIGAEALTSTLAPTLHLQVHFQPDCSFPVHSHSE